MRIKVAERSHTVTAEGPAAQERKRRVFERSQPLQSVVALATSAQHGRTVTVTDAINGPSEYVMHGF